MVLTALLSLSSRNAPSFPLTVQQIHELQYIGTIISVISGVLLVPLLLINLIVKERRSFPSRLTTLYISMALGLHGTCLIGLVTGTTDFLSFIEFHKVSDGCKIQGIFYQFFASATLWLWLLICVMLYCVIVRGTSFRELRQYEGYTHLFWAGLSTMQTAIPFARSTAEPQLVCQCAGCLMEMTTLIYLHSFWQNDYLSVCWSCHDV